MDKELITIIVPTKNAGRFMPRFLKSMEGQEGPYELLIIDCLSSDNTLELVKEFESKILYEENKDTDGLSGKMVNIISEQDSGVAESWDKGVKNAKGSIIGIFGADDCLMPDTIKNVRNTFRSNMESWVIGLCIVISNGEFHAIYGGKSITKELMLKENFVPACSSFFTKDLYRGVNGVDPNLRASVDYDLWMRFLNNRYLPKQIDKCLSVYNIHGKNLSVICSDTMVIEDRFIKNKYK